jgi:hypothetical protein
MALSLKPAHIGAGLQVLDAAWQQSLAGCIRLSGPGGLFWSTFYVMNRFMTSLDLK